MGPDDRYSPVDVVSFPPNSCSKVPSFFAGEAITLRVSIVAGNDPGLA